MKDQLPTKEIIETFDEFLNDHSMFKQFKSWIEEKGYSLEEFGMKDDEE